MSLKDSLHQHLSRFTIRLFEGNTAVWFHVFTIDRNSQRSQSLIFVTTRGRSCIKNYYHCKWLDVVVALLMLVHCYYYKQFHNLSSKHSFIIAGNRKRTLM